MAADYARNSVSR